MFSSLKRVNSGNIPSTSVHKDGVICVMYKSSVDLIRFHSFQQKRNWKKRLKVCQTTRIISAVRTQSSGWAEQFLIPCRRRPVWIKDNYDLEQTGCEVISKRDKHIWHYFFSYYAPTQQTLIYGLKVRVRNIGIFLHLPQKVTKIYHTVIHTEVNNCMSSAEWLMKEASAVYSFQTVYSTFLFQDIRKASFYYCIHFPS